ncbi:MAG: hypothetical protein O3B08_10325 [Proteobacteria bacterium]|nr:hypothetical protein [Pseudomonadota bacterium]
MRMGWHLLAFVGVEQFPPGTKTIKIIGFYWLLLAFIGIGIGFGIGNSAVMLAA